MASEEDVEFFRLVNKAITPAEELKMSVKAALSQVFGDDAPYYYRGVNGYKEGEDV